jgi:hypothetical protein
MRHISLLNANRFCCARRDRALALEKQRRQILLEAQHASQRAAPALLQSVTQARAVGKGSTSGLEAVPEVLRDVVVTKKYAGVLMRRADAEIGLTVNQDVPMRMVATASTKGHHR